jgi:H+/Na+-translocating ferredoxin:NAD+ oxidoreductase subunit D
VIGKQVYGGLGQNLFNPAMVARVMLLISFPVQMTAWVLPAPLGSPSAPSLIEGLSITFADGGSFDSVSAASVLGYVKMELGRGQSMDAILPHTFSTMELALGTVSGSLGETSTLLVLLGGLLLLATRTITWHIPLSVLVTTALLASVFHLIDPSRYPDALFHLTSGGLMLCAFFIATDYVTSPVAPLGQLIYGATMAFLIFVIRTWAAFPEGVGFAVLLMNACTPLIDHFVRPRVFGRNRAGKPLVVEDGDG